jgi:hypothetical protein
VNVEQLEHELNLRMGAAVMVVRPGYGTQSESWEGILTVTHRDYPMIFQVQAPRGADIFQGNDVTAVEDIDDHNGGPKLLIRLKGPMNYLGRIAENVTA